MHRDDSFRIPALAPLLFYVTGLAAARVLIQPGLAASALCAVAVLLLLLRSDRRIRIALLVLFAAGGLFSGVRQHASDDAIRKTIASRDADRFTTLEAPAADWRSSPYGGWSMRAPHFAIVSDSKRTEVDAPLTIFVGDAPFRDHDASVVRAEGFLRLTSDGRAQMTVKSTRLVSFTGRSSRWSPARWNQSMARHLDDLARSDTSLARPVALAEALALGRSEQLPEEIRDSYRRGGTYHLLVFSGMQIAIAAAFLALLLQFVASPRTIDVALLLLSCGAPFFAGNEPSVTRSSWMIGLYALSRILHRPTRIENLVFVAALIRLIAVPSELTDAGFALTYAATGGLILVGRSLSRWLVRPGLSPLAYGVGAELATTPLTLLYFHQLVVGGAVVTILLAPLFSIMFGASVAVALLVPHMTIAADTLLRCIASFDALAERINLFFGATLHLARMEPAPPAWLVGAAFAAVLCAFAVRPDGWMTRATPLLLLIPVAASLSFAAMTHSVGSPTIEMLDVGEGDSILLRNGPESMLVDGGGRSIDSRFGRSVLIPMLLDRGVTELDVVAMSHPHPDHCGGLLAVVENLEVGELWISAAHATDPCARELLARAHAAATPIRFLRDGESARGIGFRVEQLIAGRRFKRATVNNSSVILRVHVGKRVLLLPGDAEKEAERALEGRVLRADILKVGHHGGANSTSEPFLEAVSPRIALISAGRRNLFGHPTDQVLARLEAADARTLRTDRSGTLRLELVDGHIFAHREIDTSD